MENEIQNEEEIEKMEAASQSQLIWRQFKKHRLAILGVIVLSVMYIFAIFCGFISPYDPNKRFSEYSNFAPQKIHIMGEEGLQRPYIYGVTSSRNPVTLEKEYKIDKDKKLPIYFFIEGDTYNLLGLFKTNIHLFGVEGDNPIFIIGTDNLGRDLLSRTIYGARLSLSVGLIGVFLSLIFGLVIGGISGYFGGAVDNFIQRTIEFVLSIPKIPLWMALSSALPAHWSIIQVYFAITIILSFTGWVGLARVIRGQILSLREEDYISAARAFGANSGTIIFKHLLPNCVSYILVNVTLAIPRMIIAETGLSFLGLGLRPPAISWGVLLKQAQNIRAVADYPWYFIPALFVIIAVLSFNFVGDGLRDAADPYQ